MRQRRVSKPSLSKQDQEILFIVVIAITISAHFPCPFLGQIFLWTSLSHQPPENENCACFCRCGSQQLACWLFALAITAASPSAAPLLCLQAAVSKDAVFSSHSKFFLATTKAKKENLLMRPEILQSLQPYQIYASLTWLGPIQGSVQTMVKGRTGNQKFSKS